MKRGLGDITLYASIPHQVGTPEYIADKSLFNYISDLYIRKLNGYKPPKTSRITIQPEFHGIWQAPRKHGSIAAVSAYFSYDDYAKLDIQGKYKYVLDVLHDATTILSREYRWDNTIFEKAYNEVIESEFRFYLEYPPKRYRNTSKSGRLIVEKNETVTSVYVRIDSDEISWQRKLFDKNNSWFYDCVYILAGHVKWFDSHRFGIRLSKGVLDCWYDMEADEVVSYVRGEQVEEINFKSIFTLQ